MKLLSLTLCILYMISLVACSLPKTEIIIHTNDTLPRASQDSTHDIAIPPMPTDPEPTEQASPSPSEPIAEPTVPTEPAVVEILPPSEPDDQDFVLITDYIDNAIIDLKYATTDNFTGEIIYDFQCGWLRYGTVKKLMAVNEQLNDLGYKILIWDAFRPISAQFALWEVCPDATYVANPHNGFSSHSRGNTLDISLLYLDGTPVEMPTEFDDFSPLADRDYSDCSSLATYNASLLESIMERYGFQGYAGEWWHYSDTTSYPPAQDFDPSQNS